MAVYTSQWHGLRMFAADAIRDARAARGHQSEMVETRIAEVVRLEQDIQNAYGLSLRDRDILEIGTGQIPVQLLYFSRHNRVTGIDVNYIPVRRTPLGLARVLRRNGPVRAAKTLGRWMLGVDSECRREAETQTGLRRWPKVLCMDAHALRFPGAGFDFVYSRSVFHHLPDPSRALMEMHRVLRPGGVGFVSLHLFTSPNGYGYAPVDFATAEWPHLRSSTTPDGYDPSRNCLRLERWREIFSMVAARVTVCGPNDPHLTLRANLLRERGVLAAYSTEELTGWEVDAVWQKPPIIG